MSYQQVIDSLEQRKIELESELGTVSQALLQFRELHGVVQQVATENALSFQNRAAAPKATGTGKFANISVKWACLWLLASAGDQGLTTSEIAQKLIEGGKESKAYSFTSAVSAVLSNMKANQEVEQVGPFWQITPNGLIHYQFIEQRLAR